MIRRLAPAVMAVLLVAGACGEEADDGGVRFGEREIPASIPADFPIPAGGVIGETMIDTVNHRTEFAVNYQKGLDDVVREFTIGLVERGYVIDSSSAISATSWEIAFSRATGFDSDACRDLSLPVPVTAPAECQGELLGSVLLSSTAGGLTQAIVGLNVV